MCGGGFSLEWWAQRGFCYNGGGPVSESGASDIRGRAFEKAMEILRAHRPHYIDASADKSIRASYPIHLPQPGQK